jgi:hypothetical protein
MWRRRLSLTVVLLVGAGGTSRASVEGGRDGRREPIEEPAPPEGDEAPGPEAPRSEEPAPPEAASGPGLDEAWTQVPDRTSLPTLPLGGPRNFVYLGVQSPSNSDGAMSVEVRTTFGKIGISLRGTSFFELADRKLDRYEHLEVWSLGAVWRLPPAATFVLALELGATAVNDTRGPDRGGVTAALRVWRPLVGELAMIGTARVSYFMPDVTEGELLAGLQLSILQIGYRLVDFELAPSMQGPEVGVVMAF